MKQYAQSEWAKAHDCLRAAEAILDIDPDSAASRCYYAAFHALSAVLALRGLSFTKHAAIRAALHRDLIRPGLVPEQLGRCYDLLIELRETGDYGGMARVHSEDASESLRMSQQFVQALQSLYEQG